MNAAQKFNALDGNTVKKPELKKLRALAVNQLQQHIVAKIDDILVAYPSSFFGDKGITISVDEKVKWVPTGTALGAAVENGLGAARHKGLAKQALNECGRLNPGYHYGKGGVIMQSKPKNKKPKSKGTADNKKDDIKEINSLISELNTEIVTKPSKNGKRKVFYPTVNGYRINSTNFTLKWEAQRLLKDYLKTRNKNQLLKIIDKSKKKRKNKGVPDLAKTVDKVPKNGTKVPKSVTSSKKTVPKKEKAGTQLGLFGTSKNATTTAFNKSILKAKRKGFTTKTFFKLGPTMDKLSKYIKGNLITTGAILKKAMGKDVDHNIGWHSFINLPDEINNPIAIFKSKTKGFIVLTEVLDHRKKPIMLAVRIDKKDNGVFIASMYSRRRLAMYGRWIDEGLLLYANKKSGLFNLIEATIAPTKKNPLNKDKKKKNTPKKGMGSTIVLDNGATPLSSKPSGVLGNSPVMVLPNNTLPVKKVVQDPNKPKAVTATTPKKKFVGRKMNSVGNSTNEVYTPIGALAELLAGIEVKPNGSVVVTLDAPPGSGKTRFFFQAMNAYAEANYRTSFISLEEHPDSSLFTNKRDQYLSNNSKENIIVLDEDEATAKNVDEVINLSEIIFIDSKGKLDDLLGNIDLDNDLRKRYNGKIFFVIYQRTTDGKMRGGAKSGFDADIVAKIHKDENGGRNHKVYFVKNRYEKTPGLQYNINTKAVERPKEETAASDTILVLR